MNLNKIALLLLVLIASFFICTWIFNHVNPWVSIAYAAIVVFLLIKYLNRKTKTNEKKNS